MHPASQGTLSYRRGFRFGVFLFLIAITMAGTFSAPSSIAHADSVTITEATLEWGVKQSFRAYTGGGLPSDGASLIEPGEPASSFTWPFQSGQVDAETFALELQFGGSVHFQAHCTPTCALDLTIKNPRLVISDTGSALYADISSRRVSGEYVEYGEIPIVSVDPYSMTPVTEAGTTVWTQLASNLKVEAVPAFESYVAGTSFDPLTFSYNGPGGQPVPTEEIWAEPGTRGYEQRSATLPYDVHGVYPDPVRDVVHVLWSDPINTESGITAFDRATLQPLGTLSTAKHDTYNSHPSTFNPTTGTVYVVLNTRSVLALDWDGTQYSSKALGLVPYQAGFGGIVYNGVENTIYSIARNFSPRISRGTFNPDGTLSFVNLGKAPANFNDATQIANYPHTMLVDQRGSLFIGRAVEGIGWVTGYPTSAVNFATMSAVPGTAEHSYLGLGRNGYIYGVSRVTGTITSAFWDGTTYAAGPVIDVGTGAISVAGDPAADILYVRTSSAFLIVQNGRISQSWELPAFLGSAVAHTTVTTDPEGGVAYTSSGNKLYRFTDAGYSPSIASQPLSATVAVSTTEPTRNVSFTASATGSPEPGIQWQKRPVGVLGFSNIPEATEHTLTIAASLADNGTEYRAVFSNIGGSIATDAAVLTVTEGEPEPGTDASQTITTTIVSTGGLSISVGSTQVALPTPVLNGAGDALISSGALNPVTVTDQRSANPGWNLNGQVSAFTSTDNSFGGEHLGWTPEVVSQSGSQNVSAGAAVAPGGSLSTGAGLASAPAGAGVGTAVVGAGLELSVPTTTAPGDYSATLTLTVI